MDCLERVRREAMTLRIFVRGRSMYEEVEDATGAGAAGEAKGVTGVGAGAVGE